MTFILDALVLLTFAALLFTVYMSLKDREEERKRAMLSRLRRRR